MPRRRGVSRARIGRAARTLTSASADAASSSSPASVGEIEDLPGFPECATAVTGLAGGALSEDDAISALRDAFGWNKQTYWRKSKVEEAPTLVQVESAISVLRDKVGMTEDQVAEIVKKFPEFLGCSPSLLEKNVDYVGKTFFVRDKALLALMARKPQVLGNTVDCEGNCVGECNRCWVRF